MSAKELQEMEQSKTAVNSNAKAGDPMQHLTPGAVDGQTGSYEDLGGPTPQDYKPDNDSAKLKEPKIKTVKDVVNKGAKPADPMQKMSSEEVDSDDEVLEEEEVSTEEVVAEQETEEYDIEEDVNALLGGEELSEEFREKAKVVFEAALNSKVAEIQEALEVQYGQALDEARQELKGELTERVDSYLEYVSQEWMTENELAIEHGLKTEMTESFLCFFQFDFILDFKSLGDFGYLRIKSGLEYNLSLFSKLFGELFTTKESVNIFFDVVLFFGSFCYNLFFLFQDIFGIDFVFFLHSLHRISGLSTLVNYILDGCDLGLFELSRIIIRLVVFRGRTTEVFYRTELCTGIRHFRHRITGLSVRVHSSFRLLHFL